MAIALFGIDRPSQYLEANGLTKGEYERPSLREGSPWPCCVVGAVQWWRGQHLRVHPWKYAKTAETIMYEAIHRIINRDRPSEELIGVVDWNDMPERTQAEAVEVLCLAETEVFPVLGL